MNKISKTKFAFTKPSRAMSESERRVCVNGCVEHSLQTRAVAFNARHKCAFTLAEVLITLGIIGVVAAMTIPTLLTKLRNDQFKVAYKKAYSTLNQAIKYAEEEGEISLDLTSHKVYVGEVYYNASENYGKLFKYLARYFKAKTTCFENNADVCWSCDDGESGLTVEAGGTGAPEWLGCRQESYAFIDGSGIGYYLYKNEEYPILIDVNGKTKPNQLGRDRFVVIFGNSLEPNNTAPSYANAVLPWRDFKNKDRWCPQGGCYYKTWLQRK